MTKQELKVIINEMVTDELENQFYTEASLNQDRKELMKSISNYIHAEFIKYGAADTAFRSSPFVVKYNKNFVNGRSNLFLIWPQAVMSGGGYGGGYNSATFSYTGLRMIGEIFTKHKSEIEEYVSNKVGKRISISFADPTKNRFFITIKNGILVEVRDI